MTSQKERKGTTFDDLVSQGEEALHRLAELPGGHKALGIANDLRTRVDELSKRVRGVDALEARIAKLEREVAALKRAQKAAPKTPARKAAAS